MGRQHPNGVGRGSSEAIGALSAFRERCPLLCIRAGGRSMTVAQLSAAIESIFRRTAKSKRRESDAIVRSRRRWGIILILLFIFLFFRFFVSRRHIILLTLPLPHSAASLPPPLAEPTDENP